MEAIFMFLGLIILMFVSLIGFAIAFAISYVLLRTVYSLVAPSVRNLYNIWDLWCDRTANRTRE